MANKGRTVKQGRTIREAKRGLSRRLLAQPGVSGVGIGEAAGNEQIVVYLAEDTPAVRALVPREADGYPVAVEVIGTVVPRAAGDAATYRPSAAHD
jgi:hypothetical protein